MDEPVYKLSDLRRAFGLSENGFRLYERMGLVRCSRNEENGYRIVTLSEGVRLAGSYDLVHAGFTIRQVNELIDQPLDAYVTSLDEACARMERQIRLMTIYKSRLEHRVQSIREFETAPSAVRLVEPGSVYFLPLHDENLSFFQGSFDDAALWNQAFPLTDTSLVIELSEDWSASKALFGPSAHRENALAGGLPLSHAQEFCPCGTPCLHAYVRYSSSKLPDTQAYRHIFEFMAAHGLRMAGHRILHSLLDLTDRTQTTRLDEVLVPLESPVPSSVDQTRG